MKITFRSLIPSWASSPKSRSIKRQYCSGSYFGLSIADRTRLMNSHIALLYTAKTIATSSVIVAARSIGLRPSCDQTPELLEDWIKNEAREDPGNNFHEELGRVLTLISGYQRMYRGYQSIRVTRNIVCADFTFERNLV